jgi:hypothetical protein
MTMTTARLHFGHIGRDSAFGATLCPLLEHSPADVPWRLNRLLFVPTICWQIGQRRGWPDNAARLTC